MRLSLGAVRRVRWRRSRRTCRMDVHHTDCPCTVDNKTENNVYKPFQKVQFGFYFKCRRNIDAVKIEIEDLNNLSNGQATKLWKPMVTLHHNVNQRCLSLFVILVVPPLLFLLLLL